MHRLKAWRLAGNCGMEQHVSFTARHQFLTVSRKIPHNYPSNTLLLLRSNAQERQGLLREVRSILENSAMPAVRVDDELRVRELLLHREAVEGRDHIVILDKG